MEYLSDKVNSITGDAISGVNEMRRKWAKQKGAEQGDSGQMTTTTTTMTTNLGENANIQSSSRNIQPLQIATSAAAAAATRQRRTSRGSPHAHAGFPFGGDSSPPPPPIGWRRDLLTHHAGPPIPATVVPRQPTMGITPATSDDHQASQPQQPKPIGATNPDLNLSDESLYQGDTWSRLWFQRVMILSLLRLLLFIRKVYEDFHATKVYNLTGQTGYFLIAATTLFLPTIVFTIYRVSRYLQLALPPLREQQQHHQQQQQQKNQKHAGPPRSSSTPGKTQTNLEDHDDAQLTRALMSSPDQSVGGTVPPLEDDGLVTARQTPVNLDEFHDSKSQQEVAIERASSSKKTSATRAPKLESVDVDKMGDLPDKDTVRVFTGASEQLLHGVLFIFWQLKRQVDVMGYLVERACLWRKPAEREKETLGRLRTGSDGLEWFQDFYAAFLAILAQVYTLGLHWSGSSDSIEHIKKLSAAQLSAATSSLSDTGSDSSSGGGGGEPSISQSARVISNILGMQSIGGNTLGGNDVLLMSELIVSSAVVMSLLICVRRRDDGPLTLGLSMLGWGSLFASRIIVIALSFVHIGWTIILPLVVVHVLCITGWIYSIALDSHNERASERLDEDKWDEETAIELEREQGQEQEPAFAKASPMQHADNQQQVPAQRSSSVTSSWSLMEHLVLLAQIVILFALPSLFYWPTMFNLKFHLRPFKYLVLVLIQNFLLIPAIWYTISAQSSATAGQLYLLGAVGALSVVGFIFISLYVACKPSLTEYFARADELFNEAEKCGIYYEFCSRVFKMPDLSKQTFRRLMNQSEEIVEEQYRADLEDETAPSGRTLRDDNPQPWQH